MKKIFKLLFASAALLAAFVSCQKVEEINEAPKVTHTVKFTTEMPTKTSYEVEDDKVKYSWEAADKDRLKVFEDGELGEITDFDITEGVLKLKVSFFGSSEGAHTYTAFLNGEIKSDQVETSTGSYDPDCDILVAKPVQSSELVGESGVYTFSFRRPVAITELKLKGLKGAEVSKVTIISDSGHPIAGKYTQSTTDDSTGEWSESSNKIVVSFGTEQDGTTPKTKTVGDDGVLPLSIVTCPIRDASVKVLVETSKGKKYRKVTDPALTLLADVVKAQGIGLTAVTEAEHEEDGWYLVTDASELFDGDEIRIACPSKGMVAGEFAVDDKGKTGDYLVANEATFTPETYEKLTGVHSENRPNTFTLVENYGTFALVNENGKLGTTNVKKMSYDDGLTVYAGVTEWTIAIADNLATISAGETYGKILCNVNSTRFCNYTSNTSVSMLLPHLYKKYGAAEDPIIKIARTASFSPETATVTIGAGDKNVFPELSFEPAEASDGTQTWTSSNTEVATVDEATGEVTLVSDGTTTIKVEIAETETYQPCSAEYVLTVKPAPVEGLDIIDNDFVGKPISYTSWNGKVATSGSGNTYAGNSMTKSQTNNIQMRAQDNSGIVVTASGSGKVARKVSVVWADGTVSGRSVKIYGKNKAYSGTTGASDLYSETTRGTELGSITYNTSTELTITGDYEYVGILPVGGALYVENISIQWEDPKPEYQACFKDANGTVVKEVNATVGEVFSAPHLYKDYNDENPVVPAMGDPAFESSNDEVATVDEWGVVTIIKKGDAVITATLNGDATHKTTEVSYTIHVANVLSSIEITTKPTKKSYYVGDAADYSGIAVTAHYNDETTAEIAFKDLEFSGFDSSEAKAEQEITVSYTENDVTKKDSYTIEIIAASTLYDIDVTAAADANGNSVTVEGSKEKAEEGDEITLNVNLATGYKLTSLKVNEVEHSADAAEGKYNFTMPAEDVTVTAEFSNLYTVTLTQPASNGTVKVQNVTTSLQSIAYGTTVSVLAEPADGYELDSWTITGATLADATSASTSFTMPANDVTITASFKEFSYLIPNGNYAILAKRSSGNYFYMTSDLGTAGTKRFQAADYGSTSLPASITFDNNTSIWTVTNVNNGIIISHDSYQITWSSGNSADLGTTGINFTVGASSVSGAVNVSFRPSGAEKDRVLSFNKTSDNNYFAFYEGTQVGDLFFVPASVDNTPKFTLLRETISGVVASGVSNKTESGVYSIANAQDSDISITTDGSVVTSASVSSGTLTYSVSENTDNTPRNGSVTLTFGGTPYVVTISQNAAGGSTVTWTRVTTIAELTAGGTFIMGYEANAKSGIIVPLRSADCNATTTANGYFNTGITANSSTNGTIDMSKLTESSAYEVTITSPTSGIINIQMPNNNYYGATSEGKTSNKARLYTSGNSAETNLTPEFSSETDNQFKLTSGVEGQYKYLKYNTSSPRFAYYNSAGSNIVFYKKSN